MPVHIQNDQKEVRVNLGAVKQLFEKCLIRMKAPRAEVSLLFVNDKAIRALNYTYRGVRQATDILSFNMRERRKRNEPLPPHPEVLGDLVISLATVRRQARERGISLQAELDFVLIHGLLHLLGYDHTNQTQKLRMDALHASLLKTCRGK
jgi:probable rRNA maturation factor